MIARPYRRARWIGVMAVIVLPGMILPAPAQAQFGLSIVYDPSNYAQNILTAARSLQQINNQIQMLENQAQGLINQAKNLASLPMSTLSTLNSQIQRTQQLLSQAQRIAYSVTDIQTAFIQRYSGTNLNASQNQMVASANARWKDSISAFQDALSTHATVVGNFEGTRASVNSLVTASQSATGSLQAAQATNQLLGLLSQEIADLTATLAAQGRADSLAGAGKAASEAEAKTRFQRFLGNK